MLKVVTFEYVALISLCRPLTEKITHQTSLKKKVFHQQQHQTLAMAGTGQERSYFSRINRKKLASYILPFYHSVVHLHILKFHICIVDDFKLDSHISSLMFVMCITCLNN